MSAVMVEMMDTIPFFDLLLGKPPPELARNGSFLTIHIDDKKLSFRPDEARKLPVQNLTQQSTSQFVTPTPVTEHVSCQIGPDTAENSKCATRVSECVAPRSAVITCIHQMPGATPLRPQGARPVSKTKAGGEYQQESEDSKHGNRSVVAPDKFHPSVVTTS